MASVASFSVDRPSFKLPKKINKLDTLPLLPSTVAIELRGVRVAEANALRRVLLDEMLGFALQVQSFNIELSTEALMLPQFVNSRIHNIPLRPDIPQEVLSGLAFKLDVANLSETTKYVYAGDMEITRGTLKEPIFNPTFRLAFLTAGKRIVIDEIVVVSDLGMRDAAFMMCRNSACEPIDLEEFSDDEIRHEKGVAVDLSGFKISSMLSQPRQFRLTANIPSTPPNSLQMCKNVYMDACTTIVDRVTRILKAIEDDQFGGIQFTSVQLESGLYEGTLQISGETHTVGALIRQSVYYSKPAPEFVTYQIVEHENNLKLNVRHKKDIKLVLINCIKEIIKTFESIHSGIAKSAPQKPRHP